jgi:hypothetical protein
LRGARCYAEQPAESKLDDLVAVHFCGSFSFLTALQIVE